MARDFEKSNFPPDDVLLDDLPEPYRSIAEIVGIDLTVEIAKRLGCGMHIYFPKAETIEVPLRNRRIRTEYNGYNARALAQKYNLTEAWVRHICGDLIEEARRKPCDGQIAMFG